MNILIDIIMPVFGLAILGYLAARLGWFEESGIKGLSSFVFNFAIPVMLFRTIATAQLPDSIPWDYLLSYYLSALLLFAIGILLGTRVFHQSRSKTGIFGMGASYSNVVLMGIPLVVTTFGEIAIVPLFLIISTHAAVMFFTTTTVMEAGKGNLDQLRHLPWQTVKVLSRNVIVLGLLAGLGFNLFGLTIPGALDPIARSLSGAALPCAVFSMGASLSQYPVRGSLREAAVLIGLKNVIHPALVWFMASQVFTLDSIWVATAVLLAACPIGINTYLFAQKYNALVTPVAAAVVLSTGLSFLSLSIILLLMNVR